MRIADTLRSLGYAEEGTFKQSLVELDIDTRILAPVLHGDDTPERVHADSSVSADDEVEPLRTCAPELDDMRLDAIERREGPIDIERIKLIGANAIGQQRRL